MSAVGPNCDAEMLICPRREYLQTEIDRLRGVLTLAAQDLSLIVAKHAIGKDRTAIRMTKYLHDERRG